MDDIIIHMSNFLPSTDVINLLSSCKQFNKLKNKFLIEKQVNFSKIENLWYFDNFTNVIYYDLPIRYPVNIKKLVYFGKEKLPRLDDRLCIPYGVTDLTLSNKVEYNSEKQNHMKDSKKTTFIVTWCDNLEYCIPRTITNLQFEMHFDQNMACIPNHITCLEFKYQFIQNIRSNIPNTISCLRIGFIFNDTIKNCIPVNVKQLCFIYVFQEIENKPASLIGYGDKTCNNRIANGGFGNIDSFLAYGTYKNTKIYYSGKAFYFFIYNSV